MRAADIEDSTQTGPSGYEIIIGPTVQAFNVPTTGSCGAVGCLTSYSTRFFTEIVYTAANVESTTVPDVTNGGFATNYLLPGLTSIFRGGNPYASCTTVSLQSFVPDARAAEQPLRKRNDPATASKSMTWPGVPDLTGSETFLAQAAVVQPSDLTTSSVSSTPTANPEPASTSTAPLAATPTSTLSVGSAVPDTSPPASPTTPTTQNTPTPPTSSASNSEQPPLSQTTPASETPSVSSSLSQAGEPSSTQGYAGTGTPVTSFASTPQPSTTSQAGGVSGSFSSVGVTSVVTTLGSYTLPISTPPESLSGTYITLTESIFYKRQPSGQHNTNNSRSQRHWHLRMQPYRLRLSCRIGLWRYIIDVWLCRTLVERRHQEG